MSFRFYRRIKIAPGLSLNLSKGGGSVSAGVRGARTTFGTSGLTSSLGLPGTGLSYRKHAGLSSPRRSVYRTSSGTITASSKKEAARQLALRDPSLGGTLGQRENDQLFRDLIKHGPKELALNTQQAKEMLEKLRRDPRLKLMNRETGRRINIAELEAKIRKMERQDERERERRELEEKIAANEQQIEEEEKQYEELLNNWRNLPQIPSMEDIRSTMARAEYKQDIDPPAPIDWDREKKAFVLSTIKDMKAQNFWLRLVPGIFLKPKAKTIANGLWAGKKTEVFAAYNNTVEEYQAELARRKAKWDYDEDERIARWQRLLDGNVEEIYNTAVSAFQCISFPFHTSCDICLDEPSVIFVNVDLPEIEDVIPVFKKEVLKNGDIKEVRFDNVTRNEDYFGLVIGQSILIAAHLFVFLPTLQTVRIAGYTQRPRKRETDEIDTYVFDVSYPKEVISKFDADVEDLRPLVKSLKPIMALRDNWMLDRIQRPSWVQAA